jgi:hypothetical protein
MRGLPRRKGYVTQNLRFSQLSLFKGQPWENTNGFPDGLPSTNEQHVSLEESEPRESREHVSFSQLVK